MVSSLSSFSIFLIDVGPTFAALHLIKVSVSHTMKIKMGQVIIVIVVCNITMFLVIICSKHHRKHSFLSLQHLIQHTLMIVLFS